MTLVCRTTVSRFGNSRAVIIPKNIPDFPLKSKIDLYKTVDGILIKPVGEWSAEKQSSIINNIINSSENEIIPENFINLYCSDVNKDDLDFSGLEEN